MPDVGDVDREEESTFDAVDGLAPEGESGEEKDQRTEHHHGEVEQGDAAERQGVDGSAEAEDQQDVGDVGADDVAEGHIGVSLGERDERRGEFGQRGAAGHEGDGDDRFADAEVAGDAGGAVEEEFAAADEGGQTADDHRCGQPHPFGGHAVGFGGGGPFGVAHRVSQQEQVEQEHEHPFAAADAAGVAPAEQVVGGQDKEEQRPDHAERDVAPDVARREGHGTDEGADADDHEHVENIAAHHVADGHIALSGDCREHRNDQFGGRGADSDDGQADDEVRHPKALCQRGGAVGEEVGAAENQPESDEQEKDIHNQGYSNTRLQKYA